MVEYKLKDGKKIIIREPMIDDAENIISLITKADIESLFLAREPGEFSTTLEREKEIIESIIKDTDSMWFVAEHDKKIVGQCSVGLIKRYLRYRHRAEIAFVIIDDYCNLGIGGKMMEQCLSWCQMHNIEQVELKVVSSNERAIKLYQNFDFKIIATIPNALRYKDGTYVNEYYMIKML